MPLEKSTYVTKLIVDEFRISMKSIGGDASWLNGRNEQNNRSIHNMVMVGILHRNIHEKNSIVQQKNYMKYINKKYTVA